MLMRNYQNF